MRKIKKLMVLTLCLCTLFTTQLSVFAADSVQAESISNTDESGSVIVYGAGVWDYIGSGTLSSSKSGSISSGGGDFKIVITNTTAKVKFRISGYGQSLNATSTGGATNQAVFKGIGTGRSTLKIYVNQANTGTLNVQYYD